MLGTCFQKYARLDEHIQRQYSRCCRIHDASCGSNKIVGDVKLNGPSKRKDPPLTNRKKTEKQSSLSLEFPPLTIYNRLSMNHVDLTIHRG